MWRQEFLQLAQYPGDFLRVLGDAAEFLLIEVGRDLFAEQYLTDDVAQIGWASTIICDSNDFEINRLSYSTSILTNFFKIKRNILPQIVLMNH